MHWNALLQGSSVSYKVYFLRYSGKVKSLQFNNRVIWSSEIGQSSKSSKEIQIIASDMSPRDLRVVILWTRFRADLGRKEREQMSQYIILLSICTCGLVFLLLVKSFSVACNLKLCYQVHNYLRIVILCWWINCFSIDELYLFINGNILSSEVCFVSINITTPAYF